MRARALALPILLGAAAASFVTGCAPPRDSSRVRLVPNVRHEGALEIARATATDFELDVGTSTVAMRIELGSSAAELELLVAAGRTIRAHDDADFHVPTDAGSAVLVVDRFTDPPIAPGRWSVRVEWGHDHAPRTADRELDRIPFFVHAQTFETRTDATLEPGVFATGRIDAASGGFRTFAIDVPPEASVLRVDVADADQDLDLLARASAPSTELDATTAFVQHFYGSETLLLSATSEPRLSPGRWFVDVVDAQGAERPVDFRICASFESTPPAPLLALPTLAPASDASPIARALAAVVEITTDEGVGSGTIVTRDGWIVTNAHVVAGLSDAIHAEVVIALPLALERPPVESFRGRVVHVDRERDFALVCIDRGFYGQAIPRGYAFPAVEIDSGDALAVGDPLWLVGYPSTGGQGSRVTVHCTRGIVAGFERASFGRVIKTDAEINSGNSGGAAIDAAGRIVGIPTSVTEFGSGQTGFVHPLAALPEAWREVVGARFR